MTDLSGDAFVSALQSDNVKLLVGPAEEITIAKDLLIMKSQTMSKLIEKDGNVLGMQGESLTAVKMFVCWCYQDRLGSVKPDATLAQLKRQKNSLIDLWIFTERYDISELQNQTMLALITLLDMPHLLTKEDIRYIWERTTGKPLRLLAVFIIVVQIEEDNGEDTKSVRDYEDLADLAGLSSELYDALRMWLTFEMPKRTKKDKRTKWTMFTHNAGVQNLLLVKEKTQVAVQPGQSGKGGIKAKKRSNPFMPGEVIEID